MSEWLTPEAERTDTVSAFTDEFHYEQNAVPHFPFAYFFENRGIWVNAHDDFEILYVEAGRIRLYADDTPLILHPGQAAVINPRSVHFGFLAPGTRHCALLCRDQLTPKETPTPAEQVFDQILRGELCFETRVLTPEEEPEIVGVIRQLAEVYRNREPHWRLEAISLFYSFAAVCLRSGFLRRSGERPVQHADTRKSDIALYLQFTRYVNCHYGSPITVKSIAADLGFSESKLYKVCRSIQGYSPVEYIVHRRLKEAERLLRADDKSVTEICYACGFGTVSYFISRFRRQYGVTPRQFRERNTEK